jgi:dTDP-3-amino-2,3,6-trideoxy-4-keto-D-glucose/dTDP-3-amino-3,4,6-trideoxy-alpha-D-glucose/dTDP-2,6-dideoxy-D-kanosamine transaminase
MKVPFSYLDKKFRGVLYESHPIYMDLCKLLNDGDFTLGQAVSDFERSIESLLNVKHCLGVANGTDALRISLRMAGVGPGDEVITAANTFVASAGCIDELFAKPVFVDMADDYTIDPKKIEGRITEKTKAIVPVHFTGQPCDMATIMEIANKYKLPVIEDACQGLMGEYFGQYIGTFGQAGAISLHPLKVLNGTGDGGLIITNDTAFFEKCKLYRNHGLIDRNNVASFGCNSRLDTIQAVFLNFLIKETPRALQKRLFNAALYDDRLDDIEQVRVPFRKHGVMSCYHLYFIEVDCAVRNDLVSFLNKNEIEAKVHYPIPLQGVLELCGHSREDFPVAYRQSDRIVTLPVHEELDLRQIEFVCEKIGEFFEH